MGSQQLFCLRWSNHQSNMLSVFDQLLQSEALVDVTLACEGLSLRAHKVVLSACSPYFQSLFIENPCKHPIVILKDIKFTDMKALVDFMYKGEVNVTQEQLSALLKTAETLKVKGLAEMTGGASSASNAHPPTCTLPPIVPPPLSGSAIPPHPALKQIPPRSASPPSKRKKIRPRRSSRENSPHSDADDNDSIDIHGSPEVIEAKFEVSSEAFGPERPADQDSHPDNISDLQGDPSRESHEDSTPAGYVNSAPRMNNTNSTAPHSAPATPPIPLLPPLPPQQQQPQQQQQQQPPPPPPTLPASLPSTSGTQSASQEQSTSLQETFKEEDSSNCTPPFHPRGLPGGSSFLDVLHSGAFRGRFTTPPGLQLNNPISPSIYRSMEPVSPSSSSGSSHPKRGQPRILNEEEEKMIVRYIMEMAERGKPVTRKCVLEYGNMLLRRHDRVPTGSIHCNPEKGLSNDWWKEFKKRHPGLPFRLSVPPSS